MIEQVVSFYRSLRNTSAHAVFCQFCRTLGSRERNFVRTRNLPKGALTPRQLLHSGGLSFTDNVPRAGGQKGLQIGSGIAQPGQRDPMCADMVGPRAKKRSQDFWRAFVQVTKTVLIKRGTSSKMKIPSAFCSNESIKIPMTTRPPTSS